MIIKADDYVSFYVMYSGLRMILGIHVKDPVFSSEYELFHIDKAATRHLLQQLHDQNNEFYKQAQEEYNITYGYKFELN